MPWGYKAKLLYCLHHSIQFSKCQNLFLHKEVGQKLCPISPAVSRFSHIPVRKTQGNMLSVQIIDVNKNLGENRINVHRQLARDPPFEVD
jgi:hypothetical protein